MKKTSIYCIIAAALFFIFYMVLPTKSIHIASHALYLSPDEYGDSHLGSIGSILLSRIREQPFNLIALGIFVLAVIHTFLASTFTYLSKKVLAKKSSDHLESFSGEVLRFFGEVEVIFGLWLIPLLVAMAFTYDWPSALHYLESRSYVEPMFVVVIMALASTYPIVHLAEKGLDFFAHLCGDTLTVRWWLILTLGPLLGSLITEPAAMTLSALLLGSQFYTLKPSKSLAYATLGLLFTNVSVGGILTNFGSLPVLLVSGKWQWTSLYMLTHYGWKAVLGILLSTGLYFLYFKNELKALELKRQKPETSKRAVPLWITLIQVLFLFWVEIHSDEPVVFIGAFLLFVGFMRATTPFQNELELKTPILVGFFKAALIVHVTLQTWWMEPILSHVSKTGLFFLSFGLSIFNDNAAIIYLASLIPDFGKPLQYAVMAGAISSGGLTIMSNAPNPVGYALFDKYFPNGIVALGLFCGALIPTFILVAIFFIGL